MKRILMTLCAALTLGAASAAGTTPALGDEKSLYDLLDLERPGMEAVKKAVAKGNVAAADKELLKYFRTRKSVELFGLDLENVKVNKLEQKQADEALEHKFYAHKGYQPSYFYGDDIDWRYWPVKDNELRWQLHRHYWTPSRRTRARRGSSRLWRRALGSTPTATRNTSTPGWTSTPTG